MNFDGHCRTLYKLNCLRSQSDDSLYECDEGCYLKTRDYAKRKMPKRKNKCKYKCDDKSVFDKCDISSFQKPVIAALLNASLSLVLFYFNLIPIYVNCALNLVILLMILYKYFDCILSCQFWECLALNSCYIFYGNLILLSAFAFISVFLSIVKLLSQYFFAIVISLLVLSYFLIKVYKKSCSRN